MPKITVELLSDGSLVLPPMVGEQFSNVKIFQVTLHDGLLVLVPQRESSEERMPSHRIDFLPTTETAPSALDIQAHRLDYGELLALPPRVQEIGRRVNLMRFAATTENGSSAWDCLAGMISISQPVNIEEMLDASSFESAHRP